MSFKKDSTCCNCLQAGVEIRVTPCQCAYHTRCFPVSHLAKHAKKNAEALTCPSCKNKMTGLYVIPIDIRDLREASSDAPEVQIPVSSAAGSSQKNTMSAAAEEFYLSLAPIFLFETGKCNYTNIGIAEDVDIRNGRWTPEEIAFIECLMKCFKSGCLPLSTGITLNNFLRSIFLCKPTRLRKKIKNANFCTSTFLLRAHENQQQSAAELSLLQEKFLNSLDDKKKQKLLRFSMGRMWTTYFFNLCLHLGYEFILAQDWLNSLEMVEGKVQMAKKSKKARERRNRIADMSYRNRGQYGSSPSHQNRLDGSNHSHRQLNLDSSNHSHHQLNLGPPPNQPNHHDRLNSQRPNHSVALDWSNHSQKVNLKRPNQPSNPMDGSNHSHGISRMDNSNHTYAPRRIYRTNYMQQHPTMYHPEGNASLASSEARRCRSHSPLPTQPTQYGLERPMSTSPGPLSSPNSAGRLSRSPVLPTQFIGSAPNFLQAGVSQGAPKTPPPIAPSAFPSGLPAVLPPVLPPLLPPNKAFVAKGMPPKPAFVPTEIKDFRDDSGDVSDVSDTESNGLPSISSGIDSSLDVIMQEIRSPKRVRTEQSPEKDAIEPLDLDEPIEEVATDVLCDLSDVCEQFGDWSPFVQKVSDFIETEEMPFEYFDVWMVSNNDKNDVTESDSDADKKQNSKNSEVVLRHVGHAARPNIDSIWTLYHMNEFGKLSTNFNFSPGVGLPGRVLMSGQPLWDDSIPDLSTTKFPRVEGARTHGIKKALGIPMFHTPFGKIVVAMYSSENISKDATVLQKCCRQFQGSNVVDPKWTLVLDVGESSNTKNAKALPCSTTATAGADIDHDEQIIVNLLAKHAPLNLGNSDPFSTSHTSLRLLLLRPPSKRTVSQNDSIDVIKMSYKNYIDADRAESDVANLLVHEWKFLTSTQTQTPSVRTPRNAPAGTSMPSFGHNNNAHVLATQSSQELYLEKTSLPSNFDSGTYTMGSMPPNLSPLPNPEHGKQTLISQPTLTSSSDSPLQPTVQNAPGLPSSLN